MPSKLVFNSVIAIKRIEQGRIAKTDTFNNLTGVNMPILNGKKVIDLEIDGVNPSDYPDFCDAYFSSGCYEDGTPLTDEELERLTDLAGDVLWEMAFDRIL